VAEEVVEKMPPVLVSLCKRLVRWAPMRQYCYFAAKQKGLHLPGFSAAQPACCLLCWQAWGFDPSSEAYQDLHMLWRENMSGRLIDNQML